MFKNPCSKVIGQSQLIFKRNSQLKKRHSLFGRILRIYAPFSIISYLLLQDEFEIHPISL